MVDEKTTVAYWDDRVRSTANLKSLVFEDVHFDEFDEKTRQILNLFKDKRVLDVGCGYGRLSDIFANYTGIDFSSEMIKLAKKLHPDKIFSVVDVHTIKDLDDFDIIFECMSLSSLGMDEDAFCDLFKFLAKTIICIEPDRFTIFYL